MVLYFKIRIIRFQKDWEIYIYIYNPSWKRLEMNSFNDSTNYLGILFMNK